MPGHMVEYKKSLILLFTKFINVVLSTTFIKVFIWPLKFDINKSIILLKASLKSSSKSLPSFNSNNT